MGIKLPQWMYSTVEFSVVNHWIWWHGEYLVVWAGTQFCVGDAYQKISNEYSVEITICNFGFKATLRCNPTASFLGLANIRKKKTSTLKETCTSTSK